MMNGVVSKGEEFISRYDGILGESISVPRMDAGFIYFCDNVKLYRRKGAERSMTQLTVNGDEKDLSCRTKSIYV